TASPAVPSRCGTAIDRGSDVVHWSTAAQAFQVLRDRDNACLLLRDADDLDADLLDARRIYRLEDDLISSPLLFETRDRSRRLKKPGMLRRTVQRVSQAVGKALVILV